MLENKAKSLKLLVILVIIAVAAFVFFFEPKSNDDELVLDSSSSVAEQGGEDSSLSSKVVICDVSGAVNSPKVVELPEGSRIEDAIEAAGGLTDKADITNINRAAVVNDGDKIIIPEKGAAEAASQQLSSDTGASGGTTGASGTGQSNDGTASQQTQQPAQQGSKININSADSTQLQTITGIGPVTAQKIIDYRTQNGLFAKIEEIKNVSGIGDKTFEKMKDQITV